MQGLIGHRLGRYGITGFSSLLTHLLVLIILVEGAGWASVPASTLGFIASIVVSFTLQHHWVFAHDHPVRRTLPRFLVVTLVGMGLNASIMAVGTGVLSAPYVLAQVVAFVAIPVSNYLLNRRWTFDTPNASEDFQQVATVSRMSSSHRWFVSLLMISFVCTVTASVLHLDLARDLAIAYDMRQSRDWLLVGPQLAGVFNLGPIWYYLLAGLQAVGMGVTGIALTLTLIASLAFVLVYRAGALWSSPGIGLIWAMLLLVPGWQRFEQVFITHPILTTPLLASMLVFGLQFLTRGRIRDLILMSLSFSLALHAHPTSLMVIALPFGLVVMAGFRHGARPVGLILAALVALLPFLPYLIDQQLSGWPLLSELDEFQSGQAGVFSVSNAMTIAGQLLGGGLHYCLRYIVGLPSLASLALTGLFCLTATIGLVGALIRVFQGDRIALLFWITLVSGWLGLVGLRVVHPYYMLTPIWFVLSGLIAIGLSTAFAFQSTRMTTSARAALPIACVSLLVALHLVFVVAATRTLQVGHWPFAINPVMDVKHPVDLHRPHPLLSAVQSRQTGRWLCRNSGLAIHGSLALTLIHGYAMDARLTCSGIDHSAGGSEAGRAHVIGISKALASEIDRKPVAKVGAFSVFNVSATPREQVSIALETFRDYPPYTPAFSPEKEESVELDAADGDWLVVTHLGFALSRRPEITLHCSQIPLPPRREDNVTWLFRTGDCSGDLVLTLRVSDADHVDVVQL